MTSNQFAINPGDVPESVPRPDPGNIPRGKDLVFSFRYWAQSENFGVGDQKPGWFVSLLERLRSLSGMTYDELVRNRSMSGALRFHEIDWTGKNVPVKPDDFDWVPEQYRQNQEEFPFFQFHISKAMGRFFGFFDQTGVFQIVGLDPHHNIQPSAYNDYKVRKTTDGEAHILSFTAAVSSNITPCAAKGCPQALKISSILSELSPEDDGHYLAFEATPEQLELFSDLVRKGEISGAADLLDMVLLTYEEKKLVM